MGSMDEFGGKRNLTDICRGLLRASRKNSTRGGWVIVEAQALVQRIQRTSALS